MTDFKSLDITEQEKLMLAEFLKFRPDLNIPTNSDNILDYKELIVQKHAEADAKQPEAETAPVDPTTAGPYNSLEIPFAELSLAEQEALMHKEFLRFRPDLKPQLIAAVEASKIIKIEESKEQIKLHLVKLSALMPATDEAEALREETFPAMFNKLSTLVDYLESYYNGNS
jgi:hypothetical protein